MNVGQLMECELAREIEELGATFPNVIFHTTNPHMI
jgi:hypothetical protein